MHHFNNKFKFVSQTDQVSSDGVVNKNHKLCFKKLFPDKEQIGQNQSDKCL